MPLELPEQKTRSLFKSRSSPGGGGANELRIEDRQGSEEIYLHAQRDWVQHVRHDQQLQVDNEQRVTVAGNARHEVQGEAWHRIHQHRRTELGQDDHLTAAGSQHIRLAGSHLLHAGEQLHHSASQQVIIDAGVTLTVQAGGHWLTLSPAGIFSSVPIQLGGSPAIGTPAMPLLPGENSALAVPAAPPMVISTRQRSRLVAARQRGADFCPLCEACREGLCLTGASTV
ncbi:hypothetical protein D3C85_913970 [compost metagenome]